MMVHNVVKQWVKNVFSRKSSTILPLSDIYFGNIMASLLLVIFAMVFPRQHRGLFLLGRALALSSLIPMQYHKSDLTWKILVACLSILLCTQLKYVLQRQKTLSLALLSGLFAYYYQSSWLTFCWDEMFRCALGDNLNALVIGVVVQATLLLQNKRCKQQISTLSVQSFYDQRFNAQLLSGLFNVLHYCSFVGSPVLMRVVIIFYFRFVYNYVCQALAMALMSILFGNKRLQQSGVYQFIVMKVLVFLPAVTVIYLYQPAFYDYT